MKSIGNGHGDGKSLFTNSFLEQPDFDIAIIGGGLAGLTAAIEMSRAGFRTALFEKGNYPAHKVCGEYLSNEVKPYLLQLGLNLNELMLPDVKKLEISGISKKSRLKSILPLGGFGISRYQLDWMLFNLLKAEQVDIFIDTKVQSVDFLESKFSIKTATKTHTASLCIGSYGKRDLLDKYFKRDFMNHKSPYMGVKYHVEIDYQPNTIGVFNFDGGYCGISPIEHGKFCLCYLSQRRNMVGHKDISTMEKEVLFRNINLKNIFENADFLFDEPKVINEISFASKPIIEQHVLMCGDTAGMISPLCGNGMAMAILSARMLTQILKENFVPENLLPLVNRLKIEHLYQAKWNTEFRQRLKWGRRLQSLSFNTGLFEPFLKIANGIPPLKKWVIQKTHGSCN
jgi:menaquinone-9 beta-reductase